MAERKLPSPLSPADATDALPAFAEAQLRMPQQPQPELRASEALRVVAPAAVGSRHRVHSVEVRPQAAASRRSRRRAPRRWRRARRVAARVEEPRRLRCSRRATARGGGATRRSPTTAPACSSTTRGCPRAPTSRTKGCCRRRSTGRRLQRARAVAHNHLGVNLHALGQFGGALESHKLHVEVADTAGKFVAFVNVGLAHAELGEHAEAAEAHQQALRLAIRTSSQQGESLAPTSRSSAAASAISRWRARAWSVACSSPPR